MANVAQPNPHITDQQRQALASVTPPKSKKDQRASTQNHLMFSEVRDNIVVMRDGSLRMVILASALNFDLKSAREQAAIEYSFQGFLNGLHFPVQIIVRSRKIDLDNYLTKLEQRQAEQENALLAGLMEDYIFNIRGLLEDVNIMSKSFYVIVPYFVQAVSKDNIASKISSLLKASEDVVQSSADYETHKRDLLQRTNLVAQGLAQIGVRAAVLSTQELIELYYGSYNIDEAQNQPLGDVEGISTPVVGRSGPAPAPHGPEPRAADPDDMFAAARHAHPEMHAVPTPAPVAAPVPAATPTPQAAPVPQATTAQPSSVAQAAPQQAPQSVVAQPGQATQISQQPGGQK